MSKQKNKDPIKKNKEEVGSKRIYLKQTDVPAASLDEAIRVPQAILDHYAGKPTSPLFVAKALNLDPKGSQLKVLSGAAIAFGLIDGGAQAAAISVTDLSRRILRPKAEQEDLVAKREAVLKPRIFREFLQSYDGNPFPRQDLALNVLEGMGVPRAKTAEVLERIENSADQVGFLEAIKDKKYVSLGGILPIESNGQETKNETDPEPRLEDSQLPQKSVSSEPVAKLPTSTLGTAIFNDERRRRVFITHGKNRDLVEPIKKLLEYGELTSVTAVEKQSVSKPVPEKVMDDMRGCGAAIIHVDAERTITDAQGTEHVLLNPNVLIEIGASMAFYGKRFILLVRDGVKLPSNLQGLYEVRYKGETLDAESTIKLLEAIKDIKNYSLPTDTVETES